MTEPCSCQLVGQGAQGVLAASMDSTREKTRSEAAELDVIAKTMRAALAHVRMVGWLFFHSHL